MTYTSLWSTCNAREPNAMTLVALALPTNRRRMQGTFWTQPCWLTYTLPHSCHLPKSFLPSSKVLNTSSKHNAPATTLTSTLPACYQAVGATSHLGASHWAHLDCWNSHCHWLSIHSSQQTCHLWHNHHGPFLPPMTRRIYLLIHIQTHSFCLFEVHLTMS